MNKDGSESREYIPGEGVNWRRPPCTECNERMGTDDPSYCRACGAVGMHDYCLEERHVCAETNDRITALEQALSVSRARSERLRRAIQEASRLMAMAQDVIAEAEGEEG